MSVKVDKLEVPLSYLSFKTPVSRRPWLILLAMLVAWIGCICTAQAQEPNASNPTQEVTEASPCNKILQVYLGMQLVSAQIDPESLQAVLVYYKKLSDGKIILLRLIRQGCEEPWAQAGVKVLEAPKCVENDSTKCL